MEEWQIHEIVKNLPELLKLTSVNITVLAYLRASKTIGPADEHELMAIANPLERTNSLYRILFTRVRGYEALLEALAGTRQSEALQILTWSKNLEPEISQLYNNQFSDEKSQVEPTKLFRKSIVDLEAALSKTSVIFIRTIDPFLTISKLRETLPIGSKFMSANVHFWKHMGKALLNLEYGPADILAIHLHPNTDFSDIKVNNLAKRARHKKVLLVYENDPTTVDALKQVDILRDTFTWDQLEEPAQMLVLSRNVLDQGKVRKLSEFCKSYVYENVDLFYSEILKHKLLVALLKDEAPILFRSTIPSVRYYVSRCLRSRYLISTNIFHTKTKTEVFVFSGEHLTIEKLREIGSGSTGRIDTSTNQMDHSSITAEYILLEFKTDFSKLCSKLKGKKTVHRLKVSKDKIVWQETVGDNMACLQSNILEGKQQVSIEEKDFLDVVNAIYENRPRILCDSAGMGKSILLANLAHETRKRYPGKSWVVFLVMTDFIISVQKAMQNFGNGENSSTGNLTAIIQREIASYACMYDVPESLFADQNMPLYLFFDGLDEIPANTISLALSCFEKIRSFFKNACIYVSTRPELLSQLESALCSLALNIDPFNENNQIEFLIAHWSYGRVIQELPVNTDMLKEFANNSLDTLRSSLSNDGKDIAGVPLQCLLIAEVLKMEAEEFADPENTRESKAAKPSLKISSMSQLYELVFQRKFEAFKIRYLEKDNRPLKIPCLEAVHLQIGIETIFPDVNSNNKLRPKLFSTNVYHDLKIMLPHWQATFKQFQSGDLPQEDILRVGIVESVGDGKWQLVHRTFGEYLVAMFTTRQISTEDTCDQDVLDFITNTVLKSDVDDVTCSIIQQNQSCTFNRKFKYPVVCHFINSWLHHNDCSNFTKKFLGIGPSTSWESIVAACVRHNYSNMLEIFSNFVNFGSSDETKIFHLAACYATEETFEKLKNSKPIHSISNPSLLHVAVEVGNVALVSYLLSSCGFRKAIEESKLQPAHDLIPYCIANTINASLKVVENRVKILQLLLKCKGIHLSLKDKYGKTPMFQPRVHVTLLCQMVEHMTPNYLRNEKDEDDRTILHRHADGLKPNDFNKFLRCLKKNKPDEALSLVKYRDWCGQTPLHYLVSKMEPTPEIFETFQEINTDFYSRNLTGYNVLWCLFQHCRNIDMIEYMLKKDRHIGVTEDMFKRTSLHIAARHLKNTNVIKLLISQGCDVNKQDKFGNTPLFYALRNPDHEISKRCIEILQDHKADLHHRNQNGESLFHVAAQHGNVSAMELLFQLNYFGGNKYQNRQVYSIFSLVDKKGNTPLHHALVCSKRTTISTIQFLVSRFLSDVNHRNERGYCPLQHGLQRKKDYIKFEVIEYLERFIHNWPEQLITNSIRALSSAKVLDKSSKERRDDLIKRISGKENKWGKSLRLNFKM